MTSKVEAFRKPLIWVLALAMAGLVLMWLFLPRAVSVDMVEVGRGVVTVSIEGEGKTSVQDVYTVSAPISGLMQRITLSTGDTVRADETVLSRIVPADPLFLDARSAAEASAEVQAAEAAVGLARASVERAEAELEFARSELARARELAERGNISDRALERSRIDLRLREAELETAHSDLAVAQSRLASARARMIQPGEVDTIGETGTLGPCCVAVRSPVSGAVLTIPDKSARVVAAGTPLIEVGDPRDLEVVIDVLSTDAVRIRPGQKAYIEHWGGGDALMAVVRRAEPAGFTKISALGIEEQRVNVFLDFDGPVEDRETLGHAFRIEARIVVDEVRDVISVPVSALFRQGDDWHAFVVDGKRADLRPVTLGLRNDRFAEVRDGLDAGETVILHPGNAVEDGVRLRGR